MTHKRLLTLIAYLALAVACGCLVWYWLAAGQQGSERPAAPGAAAGSSELADDIAVPQDVQATVGENGVIELSWEQVAAADGYSVCKYDSTSASYNNYKYTRQTRIRLLRLNNGTEYSFKVRAYKVIDGTEVYGELSAAVSARPMCAERTLDVAVVVLRQGETMPLHCLYEYGICSMVWSSSDQTVATVDVAGLVRAESAGTAVITAEAPDGESLTARVFVDRQADLSGAAAAAQAADYRLADDGIYYRNTAAAAGNAAGDEELPAAELAFTGDLMCTAAMQKSCLGAGGGFDFTGVFQEAAAVLNSADLAIGNLEATLASSYPYAYEEPNYRGLSNCNTPASFLTAVHQAGYDVLVSASNHSADAGINGINETLDSLAAYGLPVVGTYAAPDTAHYLLFAVNGINIALLNYTQKSYNADMTEFSSEQKAVMLGTYDSVRAAADIAAAKAAGAQYVIVYMHWGTQNSLNVNQGQKKSAQELAAAGADLIIGSHPHVNQSGEYLQTADGRVVPVVYSLGNFSSSMNEVTANRDSIILRVQLQPAATVDSLAAQSAYKTVLSYVPCRTFYNEEQEGYVIRPLLKELWPELAAVYEQLAAGSSEAALKEINNANAELSASSMVMLQTCGRLEELYGSFMPVNDRQ